MIIADEFMYELINEVKEGFKQEEFISRYTDILSKYDYIVGDWGYGQLRLKGFYEDKNQKASFDTKISTIQDYLYEYCNFGCAYFVLRKIGKAPKVVESAVVVSDEMEVESDNSQLVEETEAPLYQDLNTQVQSEQQKNIGQELS